MTLKIEIFGTPDHGPINQQIEEAMEAIGFVRHIRTLRSSTADAALTAVQQNVKDGSTEPTLTNTPRAGESEAQTATRERGKPAPGRARRTKEEIAEDEAAVEAETSGTQAISTGGARVGPEDEPEIQEQDKADEQAEVEASRNPEKPLTVDDVKAAVGLYVNKHGMPATNEDGPAIFVKALGQPPEGNPFWKMSILPDDQAKLKACVDEWTKAATSDKRYGA